MLEVEVLDVLSHCHGSMYSGHFGAKKAVARVLECGLYWPALFKNVRDFVIHCDHCQRCGNIFNKMRCPSLLFKRLNYLMFKVCTL